MDLTITLKKITLQTLQQWPSHVPGWFSKEYWWSFFTCEFRTRKFDLPRVPNQLWMAPCNLPDTTRITFWSPLQVFDGLNQKIPLSLSCSIFSGSANLQQMPMSNCMLYIYYHFGVCSCKPRVKSLSSYVAESKKDGRDGGELQTIDVWCLPPAPSLSPTCPRTWANLSWICGCSAGHFPLLVFYGVFVF